MSASWSGSMRGPRVKTPFLLLLLLLSALTGTVLCQDYGDGGDPGAETEEEVVPEEAAPEEAVPEEEVVNGDEETSESSADLDATPTSALTNEGVSVEPDIEQEPGSGQTSSTPEYKGFTVSRADYEDRTSDEDGLSPIIILIPVVLVVVIIGMIVCGIFINRRWKNKKASNQELGKEDPYLDGSSTEKVPMPMFEEDVPSVLELEMEELDQWMKKDG